MCNLYKKFGRCAKSSLFSDPIALLWHMKGLLRLLTWKIRITACMHDCWCFISDNGQLSGLLRFITGNSSLPPLELDPLISVQYLSQDPSIVMFGAAACRNILKIPTCHDSKEQFFSFFQKSLEFGDDYGSV